MSNFIQILSFLIPLIIVYFMSSNMNKLNGNKYLYGVDIDKNLIDDSIIKNIDKNFKLYHNLIFIVLIFFFLFNCNKVYKIDVIFSITLILYILLSSIIYIICHNKIKIIKSSLIENNIVSNKKHNQVFVDISFLNEREKILNKFKFLYLIPILIVSISCILTFINRENLSSFLPTNYDFNGNITNYIENTTFNLFIYLISMIVLNILISFLSISSLKSRLKIDTNNIEQSKINNLKFINRIGYGFLLIELSLTSLSISCILSMFNIKIHNLVFQLTSFILILSAISMTFIFVKSPNTKSNSSYSSEDDESNWILGMLYNNPNDPSFMVPKRFGIGWTINIGTPLGKIFLIFTISMVSISLIYLIKGIF